MHLSPALRETGTYPFVKLDEAKRRLHDEGVALIDFGKGDPREPTDLRIRQALVDGITGSSGSPSPPRRPSTAPPAGGDGRRGCALVQAPLRRPPRSRDGDRPDVREQGGHLPAPADDRRPPLG